MKYVRLGFAIGTLFLVSMDANAVLMDLVHKSGFSGCNSAIEKNFSDFIKAGGGRATVDFFKKTGPTFSVMATWGDAGDTLIVATLDLPFLEREIRPAHTKTCRCRDRWLGGRFSVIAS